MSIQNKSVKDTQVQSRAYRIKNNINHDNKYLSKYLRNFSSDFTEEFNTLKSCVHTVTQTDKYGIDTYYIFSICDLMQAAADEIDVLRAEIKKYEKLKRIVDAINAEMEE